MTNEMAVIILESLYPGVKEREPSNMIEQAIQKAIIAFEGLAKDTASAPDIEEAQEEIEDENRNLY